MLGVDLSEHRVRVVELERHGNPFNKFKSNFRVSNSFSLEIESNGSLQKLVEELKKVIQEKRIKTKYAVSSIQSTGIKSLITQLPANTANIHEWVKEHCERLLKMPVLPRDFSFGCEVLSRDESSISVEITFVRNSDLDECKSFFKNAGLVLIGLGAGIRDAQNALWDKNHVLSAPEFTFIYCQESKISLTTFQNGRVFQRQTIAFERGDISNALLSEEVSSISGSGKLILAGESLNEVKSSDHEVLQSFGLKSEYTLAAGLALKGFLPELSPINFLEKTEKARVEEKVYASLFKRVVLTCGAVIILLLLTQSLLSSYLQGKIDNLDQEILARGQVYTEVSDLERRVDDLKKETQGNSMFSRRSNIARALHEIAGATPDGVWLNRLTLNRTEYKKYDLSISGSSKESDQIADYIKRLESNHLCTNVY